MSEADALFRVLTAAPPRSREIVVTHAIDGVPLDALATRFGLELPALRRLVARSLHALHAPRGPQLSDADEQVLADALERDATLEALRRNKTEVRAKLNAAAEAWAASPDRARDERVRYVLIAVVIALSAWFYWRENHQPPRFEPRPGATP